MKIGFTGTQIGMSERQRIEFYRQMIRHMPDEFHHGDCIGADTDAHNLVVPMLDTRIVIHPPTKSAKRSFLRADETLPTKPYIERNHDIVDAVDLLIAAPKNERVEELRSGTWATIRYARKTGKPVIILPR